jgi:lysylphosphatidylglycerol synthetase-like protein (DUF2156 family)
MKTIVHFLAVVVGTALLVAGMVAFDRGDRTGWTYMVGAALAFVVAFGPGRRLKDMFVRPNRNT